MASPYRKSSVTGRTRSTETPKSAALRCSSTSLPSASPAIQPPTAPGVPRKWSPASTSGTVTASLAIEAASMKWFCARARITPSSGSAASATEKMAMRKMGAAPA